MKHIYLNLKRFDIPTEAGGVNRIASPAEWGPYIVSHTQDQLAAYSASAIRAGVDEALVKIAAVQASAVIDLARRAIDAARERPDAAADVILLELVGGGS